MKCRAMLVALGLAALTLSVGAQTDPPGKKTGDSSAKVKEDLTLREQVLARQFEEFQNALLKLKQRQERSDKQEDKDRAAALDRALEEAKRSGISTQFDQLVTFLKKERFADVGNIKEAADKSFKLAQDLRTVLDTLREDSRANKLREERERLEKLLKDLEKVIHDQKVVQTLTEIKRTEKTALQKEQNKVTQATKKIANDLGKVGAQGGEAKDTKGQAKEGGKGSDKSGEGKDAGKSGEDKKGQGKDAGKGDGSKNAEAKGNQNNKSGQGSEAKQGSAKEGQGKDGGAKGAKSGSESKAGGSKDNQGQPGKDGQAKDGGKDNKEPGIREKKAESKGSEGKEAGKPNDKQSQSKSGGQQGSPKAGGAKESKSGSQSKSGDSKSGGQSGESKQGEAKSGQSSSGQSSSKSSGEQKGASKSDPKQQPPQDNQPQAENGRKQVEDANYKQRSAEDNINKGENKPASDNQEDAIKKLEEARKKLEKLLQQTREEELERLLAALQARCEKMLAMQIAVYHGTKDLDKAILAQPDKKPVHENKQRGVKLSDEEKEIVIEADKAIQMLEAEGSAVAFPEVFQQVREDMKHVQRRLFVTDAAVVTQAIESDIIDTLKEMIEALKKAKQELDNKKNPPKSGQPPPN